MKRSGMHAATLSSPRMRKLLFALAEAKPQGLTTAQLADMLGSCAPGTDVSELRRSGYVIDCCYDHTTANGRKAYRYRLIGRTEAL